MIVVLNPRLGYTLDWATLDWATESNDLTGPNPGGRSTAVDKGAWTLARLGVLSQ
jgi:hypothetical protein